MVRRKQTYTVAMSVCSVDDGQDGFGDKAGGSFCSGAGTGTDRNPDDYKRVTVTVSWTRGGITRSVRQAGIVNNEASSAGPDVEITSQDPNTDQITTPVSSVKFDVQAADTAVAIRFAVDGALLDTATSTSATFAWDIDSGSDHVPDGTYVVSVTAFDVEGTPGPTRSRTIRLNREVPAAPGSVFGGWNPRIGFSDVNDIVEIQWARNVEPDVTGYRVYRTSAAGTELVPGCDEPTDTDFTECRDLNPPADASVEYRVVALDEDPFGGGPREGQLSAAITAVRANTQPDQPLTLTAAVDGADVVLSWPDSAAGCPGLQRLERRSSTASTATAPRSADRIGRSGQDVDDLVPRRRRGLGRPRVLRRRRRRELLRVRSPRPGGPMTARRGQAGFTLIELLVSMSIVTVVVMATISAFVSFHKNERVNRLQNESQDEARLTVERLSSQLRNLASPTDSVPKAVEKAEPFDLVFLDRRRRQAGGLPERPQHQARALLHRERRGRQGAADPPAADLGRHRSAAHVLQRRLSELRAGRRARWWRATS